MNKKKMIAIPANAPARLLELLPRDAYRQVCA